MDKIIISGLEVFARHGVFPEEKRDGQIFVLDIELSVDLRPAGQSDDLARTVDYGAVCRVAHEAMTEKSFALIEAAAEAVCRAILVEFPRAEEVTLRLSKPGAPVPFVISHAAVEITRRVER